MQESGILYFIGLLYDINKVFYGTFPLFLWQDYLAKNFTRMVARPTFPQPLPYRNCPDGYSRFSTAKSLYC